MTKNHCAKVQDLFTRYRGLTKTQIAALVRIDEEAEHAHSPERVQAIRAAYAEASIPFTDETALAYARKAEQKGMHGIAYAWYISLGTAGKQHLRTYLVRSGSFETLQRYPALTRRELCTVGTACLRSSDGLKSALEAFERAGYRPGIQRVRERALATDNIALAEQTGKLLGRPLTRHERKAYVARELKHMFLDDEKLARFITEHELPEMRRPFLRRLMANNLVNYRDILKWARVFKLSLSLSDLEQLWNEYRNYVHFLDAVEVAEELARRSKRWRRALPKCIAYMRDRTLAWGEVELAEKLGGRVGKPLTIEELRKVVEHFRNEPMDWARERCEYARALAARRIAESVNA